MQDISGAKREEWKNVDEIYHVFTNLGNTEYLGQIMFFLQASGI
jgi:hypothetical protein